MNKLYCIGEAIVDFTPKGEGVFCRNAGGAPANVAVCASKLGAPAALITKLGRDMFGDFLESTLSENGVAVEYLYAYLSAGSDGAVVVMRVDDTAKAEKLIG